MVEVGGVGQLGHHPRLRLPRPLFGSHQELQLTAVLTAEAAGDLLAAQPGAIPKAEALHQMPALVTEGVNAVAPLTDHHLPPPTHVQPIQVALTATRVIAHHRHASLGEGRLQLLPGPWIGAWLRAAGRQQEQKGQELHRCSVAARLRRCSPRQPAETHTQGPWGMGCMGGECGPN